MRIIFLLFKMNSHQKKQKQISRVKEMNYRKINLYNATNQAYECTTTKFKTCKAASLDFFKKHGFQVTAAFEPTLAQAAKRFKRKEVNQFIKCYL